MKVCPKCRFINNINDSKCKKCNTDLTAVRTFGSAKKSKPIGEILEGKTCPKCNYVNKGINITKCKRCNRDLSFLVYDSKKKSEDDYFEKQVKPKMPLAARIVLGVLYSLINLTALIFGLISVIVGFNFPVIIIILSNIFYYIASMLMLFAPEKLMRFDYAYDKFKFSTFEGYDIKRNHNYVFWFKVGGFCAFVSNLLFSILLVFSVAM